MILSSVKRFPGMVRLVRVIRGSGVQPRPHYDFVRHELPDGDARERAYWQIRNLLNYTKTSASSYAAEEFPAGYHSINLGGETLRGQRDPKIRLNLSGLDLSGKTVLDVGCNQGGMLFAVNDSLRWGIGLDYDPRMVNVANRISVANGLKNLRFYVFDLEKDPLPLMNDLVPEPSVDVIFFLSVCTWIRNWKDVLSHLGEMSKTMLFESNGSEEEQASQLAHLEQTYKSVVRLADASEDDPRWKRMLFLAKGAR